MPNQLNYPDPLNSTYYQRPSRITSKDLALIRQQNKQILFGTNSRDVVEIWIYNPDGSFGGHINLGINDTALSLNTLIDNTGPYEVLNIDLKSIANRMALDPGRYAMVANFFRDEVGGEKRDKLYIAEISEDRTELRLQAVVNTPEFLKEIYEWVVPSVPRLFAQGLVDQTFGKNVDKVPGEQITVTMMDDVMNSHIANTVARLKYAGVYEKYAKLTETLFERTYIKTLELMAEDVRNLNVQQLELEKYMFDAFDFVVHQSVSAGEFDTQVVLV